MSTDANAALAWPIEVTEPATIGEQLVARKKTPASVREIWGEPGGSGGELVLELCGTSIPGNVRLSCLDGNRRPWTDYEVAGMYWSEAAMAWRVRPFVGDYLADPLVREEGTETGWWAITAEGEILRANEEPRLGPDGLMPRPTEFERNMDLMRDLGSGPAFTVSHAQVCGVDTVTGAAVCVCGREPNHEAPMGGDGVYVATDLLPPATLYEIAVDQGDIEPEESGDDHD